ncbi:MAG TPA: porin [Accumulibacter sp.]|uniref:porin n=1 Tax=Accumulibacter sp. TaxID=2053492 RepID=UPI000EE54940|nr:porin [Accumulibacter sp.]HCZ14236.1 porin [Accumulibacter sp.]HRF72616.1 porin [Accumulibacter sp.]
MQKKIIALAVASLASGAALAQTNVTVYGIADAGYIYSTGGTPPLVNGTYTFSGIQSGLLSGSRIGFKGEEALGNGLKAIFTLEYSLSIDNNSGIGNTQGGTLNARQQFVGLSSDKLGTVALGRQYSPGYLATVNNDPFGGAAFEPQSFLSAQAGNTITPNSAARWDNAVTYTSPNWSGFTAKAIYGFGESSLGGYNNASTSDNGKFALGGNYANGPLNIDLVYQTRQNVITTFPTLPGQGNDINEGYVGASYDFKMVKIMGSYQQQNDKNAVNLDNTVWQLGAVIPVMAASAIRLGYAQLEWDQGKYLLNNSSQSAALGWTTDMSKRTTLYAGYVWTKNDNHSTGNGPVAGIGAPGESNNTFLAGLRHSF